MLPDLLRNRGSLVNPSMDDVFERFFYGWPLFNRETDLTWTPRVDVRETEAAIVIEAELPGIERKDITVEVKNNVLAIRGERKQEEEKKETGRWRIERHYGAFERTFGLPDTVLADKIEAVSKDGVLTITLPKTEKAKPREIAVEIK